VIPTRRSVPPLLCALGVRPSQAANCRPDPNSEPSGTAAAIALAVIGPMPGTVARRRLTSLATMPREDALFQPFNRDRELAQLVDDPMQGRSRRLRKMLLRLVQRFDRRPSHHLAPSPR